MSETDHLTATAKKEYTAMMIQRAHRKRIINHTIKIIITVYGIAGSLQRHNTSKVIFLNIRNEPQSMPVIESSQPLLRFMAAIQQTDWLVS